MKQTRYAIVVATRNRPDALALSLPLMLSQERLPERVLIIDSSEDSGPNEALVKGLSTSTQVPLEHQKSPASLPLQRNIGLRQVEEEVVVFPDDDSLFLPGVTAAMMRIYDLDVDKLVGGVCSAGSYRPPDGVLSEPAAYEMTRSDRIKSRISQTRYALEDRFVPDPFHLVAARKYDRLPSPPDWLSAENAILVPWMTGYRMSFRTEAIRESGFTEALGRYALFEDTDAGYSVLDKWFLVGARNALIYHHKAPDRRANGRALGAMQVLNRAFVIARSGEIDPAVVQAFERFTAYKIGQYLCASWSSFGRARLEGARLAAKLAPQLLEANREELQPLYLKLRKECFQSEDLLKGE